MGYSDKEKKREYQRNWVANRRKKWFENKVCFECGSEEFLELHHKIPEEKEDHRIWSWSWERILREVSKCVVLCRTCHGETRQLEEYHGTNTGYTAYRCRCTECKTAHAKVNSQYRTTSGQ